MSDKGYGYDKRVNADVAADMEDLRRRIRSHAANALIGSVGRAANNDKSPNELGYLTSEHFRRLARATLLLAEAERELMEAERHGKAIGKMDLEEVFTIIDEVESAAAHLRHAD